MTEIVIGLMVMLDILILTYVFGQIVNLMAWDGFTSSIGDALADGVIGWAMVICIGMILGLAFIIGAMFTDGM